jgi:hypothetical protein
MKHEGTTNQRSRELIAVKAAANAVLDYAEARRGGTTSDTDINLTKLHPTTLSSTIAGISGSFNMLNLNFGNLTVCTIG